MHGFLGRVQQQPGDVEHPTLPKDFGGLSGKGDPPETEASSDGVPWGRGSMMSGLDGQGA